MAGNVSYPYPRSDLTGSYHEWTSNDSTASSVAGTNHGQAASQPSSIAGPSTGQANNPAEVQQQRYRSTLNWVQQNQLMQMRPALEKEARRAEVIYFTNPGNRHTATPEELATIASNNFASRHQLSPELQMLAWNYLVDKFRRRGVHHHLSEGSGRLPRHQPPEKFHLDTSILRTQDSRFFQVPQPIREPEQNHLRQKGLTIGPENQLKEDTPAVQIARERGDMQPIRSANRYAVVKRFTIDSEAAYWEAEKNALIVSRLPHTPRFSEIRSRAIFHQSQYHFSDLAVYGDVFDFLDKLNNSNLSPEQKDTARRTLALECIKVLWEMHDVEVYPVDFKPDNLLMLENGLVSPCDLSEAYPENLQCIDPEATPGYQDPNIFYEDTPVFARDAGKYALGASLHALMHPDIDPPGTADPDWKGYDDASLLPAQTVDDIARILMQKNPMMRAELPDLMNSPCFTNNPVYSQEEFANLARYVHTNSIG